MVTIMKRAAFAALILCFTSASGQTFYGLLVTSTNDEIIGRSVRNDLNMMTGEMTAISTSLGMQFELRQCSEDDFSLQRLQRTLNQLNCGKDDIIFFYYSGHGARAVSDNSEYPQLALCYGGGCSDNDFFPLHKVNDAIKAKNPRFSIVMADCCNSILAGLSAKQLSGSSTELKNSTIESYKTLFAKNKGNIIVSSSRAGETSAATPAGGLFTINFLHALQEAVFSSDPKWSSVLESAKSRTSASSGGHTPIYSINVVGADALQIPTNLPASSDPFISALVGLANEKTGDAERFDLVAPTLGKFFASANAKVEIMGKNGTTVVQRQTAESFLRRLSTSFKLVNFAELSSVKNNEGKITELKVHEVYIQ